MIIEKLHQKYPQPGISHEVLPLSPLRTSVDTSRKTSSCKQSVGCGVPISLGGRVLYYAMRSQSSRTKVTKHEQSQQRGQALRGGCSDAVSTREREQGTSSGKEGYCKMKNSCMCRSHQPAVLPTYESTFVCRWWGGETRRSGTVQSLEMNNREMQTVVRAIQGFS